MTISNVSASTPASYQPSAADTSFKNALEQLAQALQSGNQTEAQQAYATLSQLPAAKGGQNGPLAQALSQIGDALKAGNLPAAQQALATLTQQARHHGHHHHSGDGQSAGATPGTTATGDPPSTDAIGGSVDLTA
jgi:hypothetical protein